MKIKKQNKKGISLIVLVITIIVMIILAATVIISLTNNGIIGKANEAVEKTNLAQVQTLAQTIWSEVYLENLEGANLDYEIEITNRLISQNIDTKKYAITADESGVTVAIAIWVQDGTVVTNTETNKTYNVGDYVDYVATDSDYEGTWQILGAEKGELLIVSSTNVKEAYVLGADSGTITSEEFAEAKKDYVSGAAELDDICEEYGNGEKASSVNKARSIKIEDIDRVSKYDKTRFTIHQFYLDMGYTDELIESEMGVKVEELALGDYGRKVTFSWDGSELPVYSYLKDNETVSDNLTSSHATFTWYDEENKEWRTATKSTTATEDAKEAIEVDGIEAKITNNMYVYATTEELTADSPAYEMLIAKDGTPLDYWLASPYVDVYSSCAGFGLRAVRDGGVDGADFVYSYGSSIEYEYGVRAVVSLASDIQLTEGDAEGSWEIVTEAEA